MFGFFKKKKPAAPPQERGEPEPPDELRLIEGCRTLFAPPPRSLPEEEARAYRLRVSSEMKQLLLGSDDKLLRVLRDQDLLRDRGRVVWGHLVQANRILFSPDNRETLPANAVYSLDPSFDADLAALAQIGHGLFGQKGTVPSDPELREFVRIITDERERLLRRELPRGYCGGRSVYFTTLFIQPSHLPDGFLARGDFPLVVNYEDTPAVMVLPSRYWPPSLVARWRAPR